MIKKIKRVKNLAVFHDFNWNSGLSEFSRFNLLYGYNYSGKTSLSRLFSTLQNKRIHEDYHQMEFELLLDGHKTISNVDIAKARIDVLVFNRDYLDNQLRISKKTEWDAIAFDLGPNAAARDEIDKAEGKLLDITTEESQLNEKISAFQKFDSDDFTEWGKYVRRKVFNNTELYDKRNIKTAINAIGSDLDKYIIKGSETDRELLKLEAASVAKNMFVKHPLVTFSPKLADFVTELKSILSQEPAKDVIIEELETNNELYKWVLDGLGLEGNKHKCSYCGNTVSSGRLEYLNQYFSSSAAKLRTSIDDLKQRISLEIKDASLFQYPKSKNDFVDSCQLSASVYLEDINSVVKLYQDSLQDIIPYLEAKKQDIHTSIAIPEEISFKETISGWIDDVNALIIEHNLFVDEFAKKQQQAREKLEYHIVATKLKENGYYRKKLDSTRAYEDISKLLEKKNTLERKLSDLRASLKDVALGKKALDGHLQSFFGRDDIHVAITDENRFMLMRRNDAAKNLSDGEKTIICLSYFFTLIESQPFEVHQDTILFIDDPISSLDSNHISQVFSKLVSILFYKTKNEEGQLTNIMRFKQVFVSTHNFDFFNFLKESNKIKKAGCSMYMLSRAFGKTTTLANLPKPLKQYNSEYVYLFSIIRDYRDECERGEVVLDLNMPNALRRFLEIYTYMKLPHISGLNDRVQAIAENFYDLPYLQKLSHFSSFEKLTRHDDALACLPRVCNAIWGLLERDKVHFESLIAATD